jgi:hypothetical protein
MLKRFQGLLPEGWTVIVLVDRGLYVKWLFEAIVELNWHPVKHNHTAISAYQHYGFEITGDSTVDIGGSFIMNDYLMTLTKSSRWNT